MTPSPHPGTTRLRQLKRILTEFTARSGQRVLLQALAFVGTTIFVRSVSAEEWGRWSFAASIVAVANVFALAGADRAAKLLYLESPASKHAQIVRTLTSVCTRSAGLVTLVLIVGSMQFLTPELRGVVAIAALGLLAVPVGAPVIAFEAKLQSHRLTTQRAVVALCTSAATIALALSAPSAELYAAIVVCGALANGIWLRVSYARWKRPAAKRDRNDRGHWPSRMGLARQSMPFFVWMLVNVLHRRIDQFMLVKMLDAEELGIYAAAVRISELLIFVPLSLAGAALPILTEKRAQGGRAYLDVLHYFSSSMWLVGMAVALFVHVFAAPLIHFIYGPTFVAATPVLKAIALWFVFMCAFIARSNWAMAERLERFNALPHVVGLTINVALNWFWIPQAGAVGAAWATVISYACATLFFSIVFKPFRAWARIEWSSVPWLVARAVRVLSRSRTAR